MNQQEDEMQMLVIPKAAPSAAPDAFDAQLVKAEVDAVLRLYQANVIREIYTRANSRGVVFFLESASLEAAREILSTLPAVERGILDLEIIPLAPFQGFLRSAVGEGDAVADHHR